MIGVRMALGALPRQIRGTVLRAALEMTLPALGLGASLAVMGPPLLEELLFSISPYVLPSGVLD